ncbi:VMAP-C domain-containing protein [Streptomyces chartreusis]|uniref:VMAP-C domain-containing protein n=1 Tax=Streptomyces chartreusis TaxID=1969 RepID=UPI00364CBE6F
MTAPASQEVSGPSSWAPPAKILIDALEKLSAFDDMDAVHHCVQSVEGQLGLRLDLRQNSRLRTYLISLVSAVLGHEDGLHALGSAVDLVEGDTVHAQRVRTVIAVIEVPLFPETDWAELMGHLNGLSVPDLPQLYEEVMAYRAEPAPPAHCTEPWLAVLHAATFNSRPHQPPPCVQLVARLAERVPDPHRTALARWAEQHGMAVVAATKRDEVSHNSRPPLPAGLAALPLPAAGSTAETYQPSVAGTVPTVWQPQACLLIQVRALPDPDHEHERLLSYWYRLRPPPSRVVRGPDRRIHLHQLPEHTRNLVYEAESEWAYFSRHELTLEFLLPRELLELPVERWTKRAMGAALGRLGEEHPVLLRSLDRLQRRDTHGKWAVRWRALVGGEAGRAHWFPEDGNARLLSDPVPAVVVLSAPPRGHAEQEQGFDELGECLRVGVPIVVWDRRDGRDEAFRRELSDLLAQNAGSSLPAVVKSLRIQAKDQHSESSSARIGRHLALLWDDPYRLPEGPAGMGSPSAVRGEG